MGAATRREGEREGTGWEVGRGEGGEEGGTGKGGVRWRPPL